MKLALLCFFFQPLILFSQDLKEISNSINQFGLDASYNLAQSPDYLISPASISTALGMTYLGALDHTKEQFEKVLYYPKGSQFLDGFKEFIDIFESSAPNTTVSIANRLWPGQGRIELYPEFVRRNSEYFRSELEVLDFGNSQKSSKTINDWVAENTDGKILNLIDPKLITQDVVLILTNAIYFKSNWAKKFNPALTREGKFTNDQKEKISVDFMTGDGYYQTYEDESVDIIELPYEGEEFSFLIILPNTSMAELEDQLDIENYNSWIEKMRNRKFETVQVPKFRSSSKLNLKEMLIELGMPSAFEGANFSGMGNARGRLELSAVVHETFMEFNEEGTEAAAATGAIVVAKSTSPPPKKFIVDRPFIYVLRHIDTNSILFIGKMSNPKY